MKKGEHHNLDTGRRLEIRKLYQSLVGVMLEGFLHPVFVDNIEKKGIKFAIEEYNIRTPYLFNYPVSRSPDSSNNKAIRDYGYDPQIMCIAYLESSSVKNRDFSAGAIIWFQDEFAFPIKEKMLKEIKRLNWNEFAIDFEL